MTRIDQVLTFCHRSSLPPVQRKALCIGIGYHNLEQTWHLPKARKDPFVFRRFLSGEFAFLSPRTITQIHEYTQNYMDLIKQM